MGSNDFSYRIAGNRLAAVILPAVAVALAGWVYLPIVDNYFWGDDFLNLYLIRNLPLLEYVLKPRGEHLLVTSNLVFLVSASVFGTEPAPYLWTVLATHLLNVVLLFLVLRALVGSVLVAVFGAVWWGTSPAHGETLGWYSVYGHVLVATMVLSIFHGFASAAERHSVPKTAPLFWVVLLLVASFSFGVGIGVAFAMPLIALLLLPPDGRWRAVVAFLAGAAVVVILYPLLHQWYVHSGRTLPLSRIVSGKMANWEPSLELMVEVIRYGAMSLLAGRWTEWPLRPDEVGVPLQISYAMLVALGLAAGAASRRRVVLAGLVLALASYAIIAAGRGWSFGRGNDALIIAGRYQYVAQIGLTIALCAALASLASRLAVPRWAARALLFGSIAFMAYSQARVGTRIETHPRTRPEVHRALGEIRRSIDAAPSGGNVVIRNRLLRSIGLVGRAEHLLPGWAALFVIYYDDNVVDGKRVYFVTSNLGALRVAKDGFRSSTLLVSPRQARRIELGRG